MKATQQKPKSEVREWLDAQYRREPRLRARVEQRLAELELEQDLIALREARGLSQSTLAKLLGVSQPAIAKLESGRSRNLELRTLASYVTALGGKLTVEILPGRPRVVSLVGRR